MKIRAEVYRWPKGWSDEPILTIEKGEVFTYPKGWSDEPILTIEGSSIYEGIKREGFFSSDEPIATVDGGRMSAAAAAVFLLLL